MARVCISEPVAETRELLERLVLRLGHEIVPEHQLIAADALLFEPGSAHGVTLARRARRHSPETALVAVSAVPVAVAGLPGRVHRLNQPFLPVDLERAIDDALASSTGLEHAAA
ncbi:MAG: hypothetical protein JWO90_1985 [Solirubrobacterales bacterium]|jgi:hypothetical protein|nr:hypothetical protein [Solirubrobacterales bacterium]